MIHRTFDPDLVDKATKEYQYDFDPVSWLQDKRNIALITSSGDLSLFQYSREGIYYGHFFYKSRGKEALKTAKEMLKEIFSYDLVEVIIGLTPIKHLGARWMSKKIGFKQYGVIDGLSGKEVFFMLTKSEYLENQKENK